MKRVLFWFLFSVLAFANASTWNNTFHFPARIIGTSTIWQDGSCYTLLTARPDAGLDRLRVGVRHFSKPGEPLLPCWTFTLVIPQGMRLAAVEATPLQTTELELKYPLLPAPQPVPVSTREVPPTPPEPAVYQESTPWPAVLAEAGQLGIKSGFRLANVNLYPLRYLPKDNRLVLATELAVTVRYEPDPAAAPASLTSRQLMAFVPAVRSLVANPDDVSRYAPQRREVDFGEYDCVIVTSDGLASYFQPLVDWHIRKGYTTVVRTVSWITANYSGRDTQEKIRNFVRDYYTNHGTSWLILGGDNAVVPCRQARAVVGSYIGNIPCDVYYADLEWSWDGDGDNIFGEAGHDTVDLYYDLYVGRASVDDQTQVTNFCNKMITHETNPPTDYLRRILLVDAELWAGYNHQQSNDSIADITPSGWSDVHFHDPQGTTAVRDSLNNGFQFCHMVGHGNEVGVYNGSTAYYGNGVISGHNNGSRTFLLNSIACHPGNFEHSDCLAEVSHNCGTGGALAVIMNTRYGWGTPPVIGPSELLDVRFYDYFFNHDTMPMGVTHAASKEVYRNVALNQQVWRWCYYELTLFADPLLLMYEQVPSQLNAQFPSPISTGSQPFTVTVTAGGSPVNRALVCVHKGTEVYDRGYTNTSGQVTFTVNPTTAGYMRVTATAPNYLPDLDSCQVILTNRDVGAYRIVAPVSPIDSGMTVVPRAMVRNYSTVQLTSIPVRFHIGSVYADTQTIASLGAGDSIEVSFDQWIARTGSYAMTCSTMLSGDAVPSNDRTTGTLFVRYRDVGVTSISVTSPVDSGASVPIVATVRNYGNVAETFNVLARINGTSYSQTRTKNLAAGAQDTVIFPAWAAHGRGTYTLACSTMLSSDMNRGNDRATTSILVHVHNVGATAIIAPTGTIDSADRTAVRARVRNFGNQTESFQVQFRISGPANWTATATVNNLAAGESTVVNFADWPVGPRGTYTASCSTMLAIDLVRGNDKTSAPFSVRVRDVEARAVLSPPAVVDSAATVAVRVVTANNGTTSENIKTIVTIGSVYRDSATRSVAPGGVDTFNLSSWQVRLARGSYPVVCSTWVAGDMRPSNNVIRTTTLVRVNDVACAAIVAPTGSVDSGSVIMPRARVSNPGSTAQTFGVRFTINPGGYLSEQTLTLAAGADTLVSFAAWTAAPVGQLVTRCSTMLGNDANPANNARTSTVTVTGTDVAVTAIVAPTGEIEPGRVVPVCHIESYAPQPVSFWTFCRVADSSGRQVYIDSALVQNVLPDSGRDVSFAPWDAVAGRYVVRCSAGLGDRVPQNDTISTTCLVVTHDVALLAIVSPASTIRPNAVVPLLRVTNYGTTSDLFPVEMVITDTVSGRMVYRDSATVSWLVPGERRDIRLSTWNATAGYYRCEAWTRLGTDINRSNDSGRVQVKVSWGEIGWQQRPDIPAGAAPVKHGGSLARMAGSGLIYALKGNKTNELYSYNPRTAAWTTLPQVPPGPSGRPVNKGGDLTTDDARFVYVLKGNRTLEFWRYDTRSSGWEQMADLPAGSTPPKVGSAIACVTRGDSVLVFCLKASGTFEFYMYDAGSNRWYTRADAPAGLLGKKFKSGSSLCAASSGGWLYAVKSRENEFYRYDISANTWTPMARLPSYAQNGKRSSCRDGCDLAADGWGGIYAFSGGNREFFFYYDENRDEWLERTPIPLGPSGKKVKAGGSLTVLNRQCWALKGNRTFEFWVYTPDTMMVMLPLRPVRSGVAAEPERDIASGFAVWPQITRGSVLLRYQSELEPASARLTVFSLSGRVVLERTVIPGITRLDLSQLSSGAYFVRLAAPEAVFIEKVIVRE